MVGQRHARELRDRPAPQRDAPLDQPRDRGQLARLGEVEQVTAVGTVPEDPDDRLRGDAGVEVCVEHLTVERRTRRVAQVVPRDAGQGGQGRSDVDEVRVVVEVAAPGDPGAGEDQRRPSTG